jgi:glycosyltransferase involved in cell wall biosynthesis
MITQSPVASSGVGPADIWVVIAAYNENEAIRHVVEDLLAHAYQVVLVDDGSARPLLDVLHGLRVHVLRHVINRGQGAALQTGICYALQHAASVLVTFDADGQHQSADIPRLIAPILAGHVDAVLGSRFLEGGRAINISSAKRAVLKAAVVFTRMTTGLPVTDTHNGLRALSRKAALSIKITQDGMAHASQILQQIASQRIAFTEAPVTVVYTEYSLRKGQRLSNAFNILWETFSEFFYR